MASVIHSITTKTVSARQREAAGSVGSTAGIDVSTTKTRTETARLGKRTEGKMSSDDFICCSVAKRSHSMSLSRDTSAVTWSISVTGSAAWLKDWRSMVLSQPSSVVSCMTLSYFLMIL